MFQKLTDLLAVRVKFRWVMFVFSAAIVISSIAALIVLSLYVRRDIDSLATAKADNTEWVLSQSEVELHKLRFTIHEQLDENPPDLATIRQHFDVFYSRATVILNADTYADLRAEPDGAKSAEQLQMFLNDGVDIVDSPDAEMQAQLPYLLERTSDIIDEVHQLSLIGIELFSQDSFDQRNQVTSGLNRLALVTTALIILLLIGLIVMSFLTRLTRNEIKHRADAYSRMNAVASTALDAVIVTTMDGQVVEFNPTAEEIFGFSADEIIGHHLADFIVPEHLRDAHLAGMKRYAEGGEARIVGKGRIRIPGLHKDGHEVPLEVSISSAPYRDTQILVSYLRDITKELDDEQELIRARDQAIAGEKAKANLLAVMSHEIRTPLNGLIGSVDLLSQTDLSDEQDKYVRVMRRSGGVLMTHVNDVLDISRLDSGNFQFSEDEFSPQLLVEEMVEDHSGHAKSKDVEVLALGSMPENDCYVGDRRRIQQVLNNLMNNAIKFTRVGSVKVEVKFEEDDQCLYFIVTDTGVGIAEEDIERIFDDFVTLDSSYMRQQEGTGLGLGISKRLIKAMGGEIKFESKVGEGSRVCLKIPSRACTRVEDSHAQNGFIEKREKADRPLNILVVEDNATNRFIIGQFIKNLSHSMDEAHDGAQGVQKACERPYDLIFMDISMPELDGVSATEKIKAESQYNKDTPIVALTAHALPEELKRFKAAGMSQTVTKPISLDKLEQALELVQPS